MAKMFFRETNVKQGGEVIRRPGQMEIIFANALERHQLKLKNQKQEAAAQRGQNMRYNLVTGKRR